MKLILSQQSAKVGLFEKPPISSNTQALVYENRKNDYLVIKNGDQISKSELRHGNFQTVYKIHMGLEDFDFEKEFPSENEIETIKIKCIVTLKVTNPQRIVEMQLDDPRKKIENDLDLSIKKITRMYSIHQLAGLEETINDLVHDSTVNDKLLSRGIEITEIVSHVSLSEERKQELKSFDSLEKSTTYKKREIESQSTLTEVERQEQLKELEHVQSVYQDYGYIGARTVFRNDEKLTGILQEIHENIEKEREKKQQREEERQDEVSQLVKKLIENGSSKEEIDEAVQALNSAYGVEPEAEVAATKEISENGSTNKDKLKEKLSKFEENVGE